MNIIADWKWASTITVCWFLWILEVEWVKHVTSLNICFHRNLKQPQYPMIVSLLVFSWLFSSFLIFFHCFQFKLVLFTICIVDGILLFTCFCALPLSVLRMWHGGILFGCLCVYVSLYLHVKAVMSIRYNWIPMYESVVVKFRYRNCVILRVKISFAILNRELRCYFFEVRNSQCKNVVFDFISSTVITLWR